MSQDESLAVLEDPQPVTVPFRGESIAVLPILLSDWPKLLRELKPMLPQLGGAYTALEAGSDEAVGMLVLDLMAEHGEGLYAAIGIVIGKPAEWVAGTNDLGGLINLVTAIVAVNIGFFGQQAGPNLAGLGDRLRELIGIGQTLSISSSTPVTQ